MFTVRWRRSGAARVATPARRAARTLTVAAGGVFAGGVLLFWTAASRGDLRGSKHDFTRAEWNVTNAECLPCHVAHDYARPEPKVGAWEAAPAPRAGALYAPVRSTPGSTSLACLSCHDANSAPDMFGDETSGIDMPARSRISVNGRLSTDHPIGVRYPVGERDFRPAGSVTAGQRIQLFENRVECSSCHDVHNSYDLPNMLVMPNDQSQMCLKCHNL